MEQLYQVGLSVELDVRVVEQSLSRSREPAQGHRGEHREMRDVGDRCQDDTARLQVPREPDQDRFWRDEVFQDVGGHDDLKVLLELAVLEDGGDVTRDHALAVVARVARGFDVDLDARDVTVLQSRESGAKGSVPAPHVEHGAALRNPVEQLSPRRAGRGVSRLLVPVSRRLARRGKHRDEP